MEDKFWDMFYKSGNKSDYLNYSRHKAVNDVANGDGSDIA